MQISQATTSTAQYWALLVKQTRSFGSTYVHAAARQSVMGWQGVTIDGIKYTYRSYGRSMQAGGHKYKVHAHYTETGKPVPTKDLA